MNRIKTLLKLLTAVYVGGLGTGLLHNNAYAGGETVLHTFAGTPKDGAVPNGPVMQDPLGNFYGVTLIGGKACRGDGGCGTVYKMAPDGTESLLYSFCSQPKCSDGAYPAGELVEDSSGNLYGTTSSGGAVGYGTAFKVTPGGTETVLYNFCTLANCTDGANPEYGLVMDGAGNFYGTTTYGGANLDSPCGCGTVFKLTPGGAESVLYSFCSLSQCADGLFPMANVVMDKSGNFYGTTVYGGSGEGYDCYGSNGCGVVFRLAPDGSETVLHSFCIEQNCPDGLEPTAGVLLDPSGVIFGTTPGGGRCFDCGTVFKLTPDGTETVVHLFCQDVGCKD